MAGTTPTPIPQSDWADAREKPYKMLAYARLSEDKTTIRVYLFQKRGEHETWVGYGRLEDGWYTGGGGNVIPRNSTPDNDYQQRFTGYVQGTNFVGFWLSKAAKTATLEILRHDCERFIIPIL